MKRRSVAVGDGGQIAGLEALPFGLLVFVVGALLAANAWAVIDAKVAVTAAAREAARSYVEADDLVSAAAAADRAGRDTIQGYGRDPRRLALSVDPPGVFGRCIAIRVTARYPVPAVTVPWIGGFGRGFVVEAEHGEVVDPFRDGVGGVAACA
jgi:hypothetical protein